MFWLSEPKPKDFTQDNVRRMRHIQTMNRRKKNADEKEARQPVKVLPQSVKYKEVTSKVAEHVKVGADRLGITHNIYSDCQGALRFCRGALFKVSNTILRFLRRERRNNKNTHSKFSSSHVE